METTTVRVNLGYIIMGHLSLLCHDHKCQSRRFFSSVIIFGRLKSLNVWCSKLLWVGVGVGVGVGRLYSLLSIVRSRDCVNEGKYLAVSR